MHPVPFPRLAGSALVFFGAVVIGSSGGGALAASTRSTAAVTTKHGFALASVDQAQYPAATSDGGTLWKTDGPALHIDAAQASLAVTHIGVANVKTVFAYGSGQVIDTTSDGGKQW